MHGSAANATSDIVDTAQHEASFKTFLAVLRSVPPMVDFLKGAGPFTVFMPIDQAFSTLAPGAVAQMEKPENRARLEKLLRYHIVRGHYISGDVRTMQTILSESGDHLAIESSGAGIKIGNAMVVGSEILCTNGVIHAIDGVLASM